MIDIILTGGGTAGHVTPNLALIPRLSAEGYSIGYIGQKNSIEENLVDQTGIPFFHIQAGKLRRYFDLKNLSDVFKIGIGFLQALIIILRQRPKLLFSKGGFVSSPVVWAAWLCRVPILLHESDITPGLANKLSIPFAKKICFSFPETAKHLPEGVRHFTGVPIREALSQGSKEKGLALCQFKDAKPVLLMMGGSQGSKALNKALRTNLERLLSDFNICHLCGKNGVDESLLEIKGYKQFDYVNEELPDILSISDVVISRAGATSIFEFLALKIPSLLIPLPLSASRGDQLLNADSFEKQGYSKVITEEMIEEDPESLAAAVIECHQDEGMKRLINRSEKSEGSNKVCSLIIEMIGDAR